jgi:hypothetical protein
MSFIKIVSHKLFGWCWFQTVILLMSASWVARVTDVRPWQLLNQLFLSCMITNIWGSIYCVPNWIGYFIFISLNDFLTYLAHSNL